MTGIDIQFILNNIRKLRERDYISQEYMAAKLGMGQNAYSKIELGKTRLTVAQLIQIAEILGVDVDELLIEDQTL